MAEQTTPGEQVIIAYELWLARHPDATPGEKAAYAHGMSDGTDIAKRIVAETKRHFI